MWIIVIKNRGFVPINCLISLTAIPSVRNLQCRKSGGELSKLLIKTATQSPKWLHYSMLLRPARTELHQEILKKKKKRKKDPAGRKGSLVAIVDALCSGIYTSQVTQIEGTHTFQCGKVWTHQCEAAAAGIHFAATFANHLNESSSTECRCAHFPLLCLS